VSKNERTGKHRPTLIRRVAGWMVADILARHGRAVTARLDPAHGEVAP
jgi:hypothetical protein